MRVLRGMDAARPALSRSLPTDGFGAMSTVRNDGRESLDEELIPEQVVRRILDDVRARGDVAIKECGRRFDGVELTSLELGKEEYVAAYQKTPKKVVAALQQACKRIHDFHLSRKQDVDICLDTEGLGFMKQPLGRVGVYVPGGRACYPSTVLMTVLPARAAGVGEIVLCTPPDKEGEVPSPTLVAADMAKVERVFKIGGAQAIAAMAFGTESVPRVDKICGPGNVLVMLAKKMVYGLVDIDGLQGPSELVIVADDSAIPEFCAADLLAQGEHDPLAGAVLITTSAGMAELVQEEIENQAKTLKRQGILAESVLERGMVAVVDEMDEAIELVNLYAPEHVSLMIRDSDSYVSHIRNAGCIFVGNGCPPAVGDFVAGPSHVLPTSGTARFAGPLGVSDFLKTTSVIALPQGVSEEMGTAACTIAEAEGFDAHCRSVELRMRRNER